MKKRKFTKKKSDMSNNCADRNHETTVDESDCHLMETLAELKKDIVLVVRCKDCKYYQDNNGRYPHEMCKWREDETPDADDYCSCGERSEDDAEIH